MLVVISPAKKLDWGASDATVTEPDFLTDAMRLATTARNLSLTKLKALMHLSDDLARLNRDRFRSFEAEPTAESTRPAALAFAGDTYQGLEAGSLDADEMAWAQDHLRILSGLYGVLRPLDAIQPYRLEMGSKLKTRRGATLYDYWGDQLSKALNAQAEQIGSEVLINCASQEYFGAVAPKALKLRVVTPQFLEDKRDGKGPKMVSFFAKKARGAMARFIIQNRLTSVEGINDFDTGGYAYQADVSTPDKPVFMRDYPAT
ncbi:peroxide stress protein YaaA [Sulfitobacter sp. F26204]|uniref:peroxide stress protein YaaA n=1 Tax=Sulfitobacter sp. F26204 TaxID=2996014 RepID=UPI00225E2309|nr:peroxide stress protein YaaA [Sulfitobacter sp. F26204]MCX7558092.1 peroxide stress protein YaaA [Sulfitobacter sp. F26204]